MSGFELEGVGVLARNFTANFSVGYIKAKFDEYRALDLTATPPVIRDFSDSRAFQNTPKWTGSASLNYNIDLGEAGTISLTPSASYRDKMTMFEIPSVLDQKAYWLYDASIVWNSADGKYQLGLHGKNLGDERYRVGGYNFPQSAAIFYGNSVSAFYGPPRTVMLTAQAKF
jgi:iron complex outermembrane receptor protein